MISGVILAAGKSSRMGQDKLSLELHGKPLLAHVILAAKRSMLDEILLIWGQYESSGDLAQAYGVKAIENKDYEMGLSTSLILGMKSISEKSEAVMFLLGDMPYTSCTVINQMIDTYRQTKKPIIVPLFNGQRGNPVLFSRKYEGELYTLQGDIGARQIILQHKEDVAQVSFENINWNLDIDTMEEYRRWEKEDIHGDEEGKA